MAEQFTEAGKLGKDIRSSLASAYGNAKRGVKSGYDYINDFVKEYGQEPLLNLYPQAVNLFSAGGEVVAGMANKPVNLGRFPYYDIKTQFDKQASSEVPSVEAPREQENVETITVTKKAARPQRLWRVMMQGGNASEDTFYDTKEAAESALKSMGGKGAVAGIKFPAKSREEESALKEQYMQQARTGVRKPAEAETEEERITRKISEVNPNATPEQKARYLETLSKSRARGRERGGYAEEYQAAVAEGRTPTAYEERRMAERASKAKAQQFFSDVKTKDIASRQLDEYSKNLSLLKRAYRDAIRSRNYLAARDINSDIQLYSRGVPKELGAREKFARQGLLENKKRELEENMRIKREQQERSKRLAMANPDYGDFAEGVSFNRL